MRQPCSIALLWRRRRERPKQLAPAGRPPDAGGRGQAQRQAQDGAHGEVGESLCLERVPVPASTDREGDVEMASREDV